MDAVIAWLRLPLRFMRGGIGRLALTVLALACGVGLICALDLVTGAVLRAFVEIVDSMAGKATLQVSVDESGSFPESIAEVVGGVPGVRQAISVVSATAFTVGVAPESLTVQGFDVTDVDAVGVYQAGDALEAIVAEPLAFLNAGDSIIVTHAFAARHDLQEGDGLELDTANGRRHFTVRGLVDPDGIGRAFGGNLVLMDVQAAQRAFTQDGMINRVDIVTARDADVAEVARRVRAAVPEGLRVEPVAQRKADLYAVMRSMRVLLQAVGLVALGAACLIAFNRLSAVFEERTWQLGVLRAVGVGRRAVWSALLKESVLLGAASVAIGIPAGILLGRALLPLVAATAALNFRTVAPQGSLVVGWTTLVLAAGLGLGAALAAAILPAWRAASVDVAETVRRRGLEITADSRPLRWLVCAGLALAVGGAAAVQQLTHEPSWGLVATALLVVLTGSLARPLVQRLRDSALPLLLPWLGATGRFALRGLARNVRRTGLAVAMVGVGIGAVIWLLLLAFSFERTAVHVFAQAMRTDFVVSSAHFGSGALETPIDDGLGAALGAVEGVESVVGVRLANWQYRNQAIVLDAFDPAYFLNPAYGEWPLHGERLPDAWAAVAEGRAVVVSSNFVQNLAVRVGNTITLASPAGPLALLIAGVTTDFASPKGTIEMSRALYRRYWNDPKVTRFFVQAVAGADRGVVRARLDERLAAVGGAWRVISSGDLVAYWGSQIRRAFGSVYALAAIILVVILFGIADNMSASIAERTRDLGTLRAVGVSRRGLWQVVVVEAVVLAAIGLLLALGEGFAIAALWVATIFPYMLGWSVDLHIPILPLMAVCVVTAVCCGIAALVPGRRAARLQPAAALRQE
ncbi:MAG: FtsX-like permease family protein [bacterium]